MALTCLILGHAFAQLRPPSEQVWRYSLGHQHYSESKMNLQGTEIGVHWRRYPLVNVDQVQLEADAIWGMQNYSSSVSGTLKNVPNLSTRWRVMTPFFGLPDLAYGIALHTDYNNLRGISSVGHGGYERISTQLWLPMRLTLPASSPWELDAGVLLWGQHESRLSQATPNSEDVTNTQRRGVYLQANTFFVTAQGLLLPYVRWAWIDNSDTVLAKQSGVMKPLQEPRNNRVQVGLQWQFK